MASGDDASIDGRWSWVKRSWARRLLLLVCLSLGLSVLLVDYVRESNRHYQTEDVADREIRSPISFQYVDREGTEARRTAAAESVLRVYDFDSRMRRQTQVRLKRSFQMARRSLDELQMSDEARGDGQIQAVVDAFVQDLPKVRELDRATVSALIETSWSPEVEEEVWNLYRFASDHYLLLSTERIPEVGSSIAIHPIGAGTPRDEMVDSNQSFLTLEQASNRIQELVEDQGLEPSVGVAAVGLTEALLQENLIYNHSSTEARRQMARDAVSRIVIRVDRGTVIVRKGDVVTEQQARTITALQDKVSRGNQLGTTFAFMAFSALLLGVLYQFGRGFIRKFSTRPRDLAAVGLILLLVVAMARVDMEISVSLSTLVGLGTERSTFWYMVPFAGGAMLVRILVNSETSLLWILATSALCGLVMEQQVLYTIFFLVSGLAGSTALAHGSARMDVLKAGVMAGLINAALALLINLVRAHMADLGPAAATQPMWDVLAAFSGGLLSGFLVLALLPLFELAGFVTDYKLLELANLNHPLLRQLMLKAPGTYHHSVTVAQLCEAAAESVGANALQTRVACYFHDIGKALQPHYFIENQRGGVNPHDNLAPKTSARIITAHMVDGAAIARQYNLPPPILDGITQHHGTGLIQYFYAKALEQAEPGEEVQEADFRYPGDLPNSKETGIMMLADRVEAACRTLPEKGDEDIRAMIQKLVNGAIMDGQLERCPLTIKELYTIVDSFADTLLGIYHHRIEYPGLPPRSQDGDAPSNEQVTGPIITLEMANPLREGGTLHRLVGDDER